MKGSVGTAAGSSTPSCRATSARSSSVVRGVIRSTIVVTNETLATTQASSNGSTARARSPTTRAAIAPLSGTLSLGTIAISPGLGGAAGEQPCGEPAGSRRDDACGRVLPEGGDVFGHVLRTNIEPAVWCLSVPRLRDRDRHQGHQGIREVAAKRVEVVPRVDGAQAGNHLRASALGPPDEERVELLLSGEGLRDGGRPAREGGVAPVSRRPWRAPCTRRRGPGRSCRLRGAPCGRALPGARLSDGSAGGCARARWEPAQRHTTRSDWSRRERLPWGGAGGVESTRVATSWRSGLSGLRAPATVGA